MEQRKGTLVNSSCILRVDPVCQGSMGLLVTDISGKKKSSLKDFLNVHDSEASAKYEDQP